MRVSFRTHMLEETWMIPLATQSIFVVCETTFCDSWSLSTKRADQETNLTTLLDEVKARRAETLERMSREVAGPLRALKAALGARLAGKVKPDHYLLSWMIRHAAWFITSFTVRVSGHTACEVVWQRKYGGANVEFGKIVWARIPTTNMLGKLDQRWVEIAWAGKAEHIGLGHGAGD